MKGKPTSHRWCSPAARKASNLASILILALGCSTNDPGPSQDIQAHGSTQGLLAVPPLVGRPTTTSVTLNVVSGGSPLTLDLRLESADRPPLSTMLEPGASRDVVFDGLEAGHTYRYEITARSDDRSEVHSGRFVTRRPPGVDFTFALLSDTHLPVPAPEWTDPGSTELFLSEIYDYITARDEISGVIRETLDSIRERQVDFILHLGDMLHYYRGFNDPFPSARIADFGYLDLRAHLGQTTAEAAFFAVIGNWEGENGWHPERLRRHARQARLKYLLNPEPATYPAGGSENEDYFAWRWGNALLVVLNVMTYTPTTHTLNPEDDGTATDWTLGAEQLAWLESTLRGSTERIKLLFIHHPVGGAGGDELNSAYGRGGGLAATVGEQAEVHSLMLEHGVQILFYGHDHVFTDLIVDGIHYTLPGSAGAPWKFSAEETGYSGHDERSGFALVHVGQTAIKVDFLDSAGNPFSSTSVGVD